MTPIFALISILGFLLFSGLQLYAGFLGIEHHLGVFAAIISLFLAFFFRFTVPITIGAFFCALNIWHWNWLLALIFVSPTLILIIPGVLTAIILMMTSKIAPNLRPQKTDEKIIEAEYIDVTPKEK